MGNDVDSDERGNGQQGQRLAATVLHGFDEYRSRFKQISSDARRRFIEADWREAQQASAARINLYDEKVAATMERLERAFEPDRLCECTLWGEAKRQYMALIDQRLDYKLAETFYNSIFCSVFSHRHIRDDWMFVSPSRQGPARHSGLSISHRVPVEGDWAGALESVLNEAPLGIAFEHQGRDVTLGAEMLLATLPEVVRDAPDAAFEMLRSVFYRNKGAYLVGRIEGGGQTLPLVLPVLHTERDGVYLDTVIIEPEEVSIIFSFTRAYFQVEIEVPSEVVGFLQTLMPEKPIGELYAAIGFYKHGKTELFRGLNQHVASRSDQFIIAPGVRGMVMAVFVLPSYRLVFKLIKDRFAPGKDMSRDQVREKYRLVKRHDRVGRLADTQEFSNFTVGKDHFDPACLEELLEVCSSSISLRGNKVLIRHCYTERMMTPLNLYLEECDAEETRAVLNDYGNAIKQLAAADIFPGDMLLKNFGVTRHGRVVFYDYDEISYLTECNFREIPEARYPEQELASEPWYSVGPNDIFPEEFGPFLFADIQLRKLFYELHPEIFQASWWRGLQDAIAQGRVIDVYPYRNKRRFGVDRSQDFIDD